MLVSTQSKPRSLGERADVAAIALHLRLRRLQRRVDLRSRRGEGNMIWTILVVGLVATVAAVSIYQFGPKIKAMGEQANTTLSAPPW
jgi:hypothetical protein